MRRAPIAVSAMLLSVAVFGAVPAAAAKPQSVGSSTIALSPTPIAPTASLAASTAVDVTLTATNSVWSCSSIFGACDVYLSFVPTQGGGRATVTVNRLTLLLDSTPTKFTTDSAGHLTIQYQTPATLPAAGADTLTAQDTASTPTVVAHDTYTFKTPVVWVFSSSPIAPTASLGVNTTVHITLRSQNSAGGPVSYAGVLLSFGATNGGGHASIGSTVLTANNQTFTTDASGQLSIAYTTPADLPGAGGRDILYAATTTCVSGVCFPITRATDSYTFGTTFYFAEGTTRSGFVEKLSLLMPNDSGTATVTYYFADGSAGTTQTVNVTAGQIAVVDVNAFVGASKDVSARVTLPGTGVAERTMHFNLPGGWHGSHDKVGVNRPALQWNFAEGSTLSVFSEYLTLQNPSPWDARVSLSYITDTGASVIKNLVVARGSRTTVEVFKGNMTAANPCIPNGAGANCGVGPGFGGVSVQVQSTAYCILFNPITLQCDLFAAMPIIAERPMYVNHFGFTFPSGTIADGDVAFGATFASTDWRFAEGTTLPGFREYLTLQNNNAAAATVSLTYLLNTGITPPVKTLTIPANTRATVEVWNGSTISGTCHTGVGSNCGVGPGIGGVSVNVHADQGIVAERPIYIMQDFGSGTVAGVHDVVGATSLGVSFGFAAGSTLAGENDYLTIENPQTSPANITLTYYGYYCGTPPCRFAWFKSIKTLSVAANSRQTVEVSKGGGSNVTGCVPNGAGANCGLPPGVWPLGVIVTSDRAVLVERPTYNSTAGAYGATDTFGFQPPNGF